MNEPTGSFVAWFKRPWLIACLLAAVTFALFSPAIGYDFINYDDNLYVFQNEHVRHGLTWEGTQYAFRSIDGASWMPATWFSYMLDTALYGTRPAGNHLTNILLHAASAGILFLALQRMTKRPGLAVLMAALFAFHPQRLESVAWIAERKDVLSVFFWMLGLLAYVHYIAQPSPRRMVWVAVCLCLGLMAKPLVMSFPVALLLLDFWPLQRVGDSLVELRTRIWPLIREKIPLFLMGMAVLLATIWSQHAKNGIMPEAIHFPWYLKLCRVIENVGFYGTTFSAPTTLSILYNPRPLVYWHVVLVGLALLMVSLLALYWAWRRPWLAVGWFWFLVTLAPMAGFIRIGRATVADRYSYLPSVGLALVVVFAVLEAAARRPRLRSGLVGALAAWGFFCALTTWADLPQWRNTFTVFQNAYEHGAHFIACDQYASELYARQQYQMAIAVCNRGIEGNPQFASLYNTRGGAYYGLGDLDQALANFNLAIEVNPGYSPPYYGRALVHVQRKELAQARADFQTYRQNGGQLEIPTFDGSR